MEIKCPRCNGMNPKKDHVCRECRLPLKAHKLSSYASNIQMQWDRIEEDKSTLFYEDSKMRLYPPSKADEEQQAKHIVYYKNQRFVLLGFVNIIYGKKAIIHFKIRPEKGIILVYKREHKLSDLFLKILEDIAETFDWNLKDITETFEHHTKLEKIVEAYPTQKASVKGD